MTEAEQIMKRCQAGTRNYEEANNLHAACYGIIGKLLAQPEQEPIYQYQMANGSWIDQTKESHDYNVRHGQATVRVVYTRPPQPEQEPVAWELGVVNGVVTRRPVARPQRTWVGLTDREMEDTFIQCGGKWNGDFWKIEDADFHPFVRTIEANLKEKL